MLPKRLFFLLISRDAHRFNGRILLGLNLLNRLCISFMLDVLEGAYGYFVCCRYSTFAVIDGWHALHQKHFLFTTNKAIKVAVEKFLEDCVPVSAGSDDENELIYLVIGS